MTSGEPVQIYWYLMEDSYPETVPDLEILEEDERQRYGELKRPELAARFLFRRVLLRKLLARHCCLPADHVKLEAGSNGKPVLANFGGKVHFNSSHTDGFGVIAIGSQGPIGVDVEPFRTIDVRAFSERILSPEERFDFSAIEEGKRLEAMFRIWTAKEAVIKALGMGLNLNQLSQISVSDRSLGSDWRPVIFHGEFGTGGEFHVRTLPMPSPIPQPSIVSICCQAQTEISFASATKAISA